MIDIKPHLYYNQDVIREITLTRFRCTCSKCIHEWKTKTHEIPKVCPKCHRVTWNDDYEPDDVFVSPIIKSIPVTIQATVGETINPLPIDDGDKSRVEDDFDFGA